MHSLLCHTQENENILVSSCGDGSIKVWDVAAPPSANPLRSFQEHSREACPRPRKSRGQGYAHFAAPAAQVVHSGRAEALTAPGLCVGKLTRLAERFDSTFYPSSSQVCRAAPWA